MDLKKFEGIDTRFLHKNDKGCADVVNFRITADGSLQKRCGYRLLRTFSGNVRAIWTGRLDGTVCAYVLVGNTVSLFYPSTNKLLTVGTVNTSSGEADFFYYRSGLYLADGKQIYTVGNTRIGTPYGYVPLRGKDWPDTLMGELHEPKNLLCNKGRITYVIREDHSSFLRIDSRISYIDAVYVNGSLISEASYSITSLGDTISVSSLSGGDRVEVYFTYASDTGSTDGLLSCTRATVFGGISNERPFLWNGNDKTVMYSSSFVSENSLKQSRKVFPQSDALYFPVDHEFKVGDGSSPITAVSRHYDRLLIFTETGAWMADSSACGVEDHPVMSINSKAGVISRGAEARLGNQPCTVGQSAIYRWLSSTDELDECNAYSISDALTDKLPKQFFEDAQVFADIQKDELIFCSPSLGDTVYVYQSSGSHWVRFDGINADRFVALGDSVGFLYGKSLYVFDASLSQDEGGKEIVGVFESNIIPLSTHGTGRISSVTAALEGECELSIRFDGEQEPSVCVPLKSGKKQRLTAKRARTARLSIKAGGDGRQTVRSISLTTRQ